MDLKDDVVWLRQQQQEKNPHWKDLQHCLTFVFFLLLFPLSSKQEESSGLFEEALKREMEEGKQRSGQFELVGFISHVGKNTGSGHYVCHIKKTLPSSSDSGGGGKKDGGEESWVIHNDRKVAVSRNPPKSHGYLYLYRHV